MQIGSKVKVLGTNLEGQIIRAGVKLVMIRITKNYNAFARTVYNKSELEEVE